MRLLLAGGGTGGHLVPGTALARAVLERGGSVLFVTAGRPLEAQLVGELPYVVLPLEDGRGAPTKPQLLWRVPRSCAKARTILREFAPDVVLGLGGLASFPVALAARSLGIPVSLLEINAVPGRATRYLIPLAHQVLTAAESAASAIGRKAVCCGTPLRPGFRKLPQKPEARAALGLDRNRLTCLVLGGSQGASAVNEAVASVLPQLAERGVQLLWIAGPGKEAAVRARCAEHPALAASVRSYLDDMPTAFAAADFAICRSGAATVFELAAAALPSITIPYPHHTDRQQYHNARLLGEGTVILEEKELNRDRLAAELAPLLDDAARRQRMAEACRRAARIDAVEKSLEAMERLRQPRTQAAPRTLPAASA